jgi:outer membrane lipoprotein-sorting protein
MKSSVIAGVLVAAAFAAQALASPSQAPPSAVDLARQVQKRYATIRTFTAKFTVADKDPHVPQIRTQRGFVKIMKPGCMWWMYDAPEKMDIVSDGREIKTYSKADNSGTRAAMPKGDDASTAVLFLAGEGDLVRDFTPALAASQPAGEWRLNLIPKRKQTDFDELSLFLDRQTLRMNGFTTVDSQGGVHEFRFSDLRENVGLSAADFDFKFPRGAYVQDIR